MNSKRMGLTYQWWRLRIGEILLPIAQWYVSDPSTKGWINHPIPEHDVPHWPSRVESCKLLLLWGENGICEILKCAPYTSLPIQRMLSISSSPNPSMMMGYYSNRQWVGLNGWWWLWSVLWMLYISDAHPRMSWSIIWCLIEDAFLGSLPR